MPPIKPHTTLPHFYADIRRNITRAAQEGEPRPPHNRHFHGALGSGGGEGDESRGRWDVREAPPPRAHALPRVPTCVMNEQIWCSQALRVSRCAQSPEQTHCRHPPGLVKAARHCAVRGSRGGASQVHVAASPPHHHHAWYHRCIEIDLIGLLAGGLWSHGWPPPP